MHSACFNGSNGARAYGAAMIVWMLSACSSPKKSQVNLLGPLAVESERASTPQKDNRPVTSPARNIKRPKRLVWDFYVKDVRGKPFSFQGSFYGTLDQSTSASEVETRPLMRNPRTGRPSRRRMGKKTSARALDKFGEYVLNAPDTPCTNGEERTPGSLMWGESSESMTFCRMLNGEALSRIAKAYSAYEALPDPRKVSNRRHYIEQDTQRVADLTSTGCKRGEVVVYYKFCTSNGRTKACGKPTWMCGKALQEGARCGSHSACSNGHCDALTRTCAPRSGSEQSRREAWLKHLTAP